MDEAKRNCHVQAMKTCECVKLQLNSTLGTRRWVVSFTLRPPYSKEWTLYQLNTRLRGPQSRWWRFGEDTKILPITGIEPLYRLFRLCLGLDEFKGDGGGEYEACFDELFRDVVFW
jgi:hypothetical protein